MLSKDFLGKLKLPFDLDDKVTNYSFRYFTDKRYYEVKSLEELKSLHLEKKMVLPQVVLTFEIFDPFVVWAGIGTMDKDGEIIHLCELNESLEPSWNIEPNDLSIDDEKIKKYAFPKKLKDSEEFIKNIFLERLIDNI